MVISCFPSGFITVTFFALFTF